MSEFSKGMWESLGTTLFKISVSRRRAELIIFFSVACLTDGSGSSRRTTGAVSTCGTCPTAGSTTATTAGAPRWTTSPRSAPLSRWASETSFYLIPKCVGFLTDPLRLWSSGQQSSQGAAVRASRFLWEEDGDPGWHSQPAEPLQPQQSGVHPRPGRSVSPPSKQVQFRFYIRKGFV